MSVRQYLIDEMMTPGALDRGVANLAERQLEAARELFCERREQLAVVRRRADEARIDEIRSFHDLVPLLLAHTSYKSYPISFMEERRWDRMLQWMQTLSVQDVSNVDIADVVDVDDWIARLHAAGHMVQATSGTTGKVSFLNHSKGDKELKRRHYRNITGWPFLKADNSRAVFIVGPSEGPNSAVEAYQNTVASWARPGEGYFLTDEPVRIGDISRMAALRSRIADGTATPGEIGTSEKEAAAKSARMKQALVSFAEKLMAHRREPIVVTAQWAQHMMIIDQARKMGVGDGEFHIESMVSAGGGIKGVALPPDYRERVTKFYGNVVRPGAYGMTELLSLMPRCERMRYHCPPALIWLQLDRAGERLLGPDDGNDGIVEGRFAFLDLAYEGRWGGLISGDKVHIDHAESCPCGRPGPTILDTIVRYSQSGGDDHIGCAGTIDAYIRGELSA
ncbi:MAG: hypothetical protein ACLQUZ_01865 [Rhizomicrobium sp.]